MDEGEETEGAAAVFSPCPLRAKASEGRRGKTRRVSQQQPRPHAQRPARAASSATGRFRRNGQHRPSAGFFPSVAGYFFRP